MGLLTKLQAGDSQLTKFDGTTPPVNKLATKSSPLHAVGTTPGYSVNGDYSQTTTALYNQYDDGVLTNPLPQPSQLDGPVAPTKYLNNLPG